MAKRHQVVEVYAPSEGLKYDAPSTMIDLRASPDGTGNKLRYGVTLKEEGLSLYATGVGACLGTAASLIYDAAYTGGSQLQILTHTGVYKYTAAGDTYVSDGQAFMGENTDYWSGCFYNDAFIYSNGVDPIQYKGNFSATGTSMASALTPTTYKAWTVAAFKEHLNLYHVIENGNEHPYRVQWSKKGILTYSAGTTDWASGTAGAIDLEYAEGEIKTAVPLSGAQAIYCNNCVIMQVWVGGDVEIYQFTKTLSGIGTPSRRGAVSNGVTNWFIAYNGIYEYNGGTDLTDISLPVRDEMFGEINQSALANAFIEYDNRYSEVLVHLPIGGSEVPNAIWVYNTNDKTWAKLDRSMSAAGASTRKTGTTIGELLGTIGDQTFKFGDYYVKNGAEVKLYSDHAGYILKKDPTTRSVVVGGTTTAQAFTYVTPDVIGLRTQSIGRETAVRDPYYGTGGANYTQYVTNRKRYTNFTFEATGNGQAYVYYSPDKGVSYSQFSHSPVTLDPGGSVHILDMDYGSPQMRFKVVNTGTYDPIAISYYRVDVLPEEIFE